MIEHRLKVHHVPELGVDVEKVPLHRPCDPVADGFAHRDGAEAVGKTVFDGVPHTSARRHARHDNGVHLLRRQKGSKGGAVEGAGHLLNNHQFIGARGKPIVNGGRFRPRGKRFQRNFLHPTTHVGMGTLCHIIGGRCEHHGKAAGAKCLQKPLVGGDDGVHPCAGKGVIGPGPGVGKVDDNERRLVAKADTPLEAALGVNGGVGSENHIKGCLQLFIGDAFARHCPSPLGQLRLHSVGQGRSDCRGPMPKQSLASGARLGDTLIVAPVPREALSEGDVMSTNLRINPERLWSTLMESARFGATPKGGIRRLALSDEDKAVRDWFRQACEAAGLTVSVDGIGNMFAVREGSDVSRAPIAFGSHLDTQPAGGKFDGILGVLAGLEAIRTMNEAGYTTNAPLVLVNWTNEEGARFAPAMMCSGVYAGEIDAEPMLAGVDNDGRVFSEELERIGYRGEETVGERRFGHFIELHIEQGPILEAQEQVIGVVAGGQGILWFDGTILGRDSHAGTTPMPMRRDALAALSEITLAVEKIAKLHGPEGVGTVGEAHVMPGSRNTIPGTVTFKAEFRHPDGEHLTDMERELAAIAEDIAERRSASIDIRRIWRKDPLEFDPAIVAAVEKAARTNNVPYRKMISGAGHDAFYVASTCPTGMIFIPCAGGISHNEEESATQADCGAGAQVLLDTILEIDRSSS